MGLLYRLTDLSDGGTHLPWITRKVLVFIQGYDHEKYWRRRAIVVNPNNKANKLLKMYYLLWIKRVDNKHNCSFGTTYNAGSLFLTPPIYRMDLTE